MVKIEATEDGQGGEGLTLGHFAGEEGGQRIRGLGTAMTRRDKIRGEEEGKKKRALLLPLEETQSRGGPSELQTGNEQKVYQREEKRSAASLRETEET